MFQANNSLISRAFNPLTLSPAQWLDASDASTLYDAVSGGSLVAPDGAVARWQDKSGNANHATQATADSRPLRKTSIQNGLAVMRFDGSNDCFDYATSVFSYSGAASVLAVTKNLTNAASDYGAIIAEHNAGGSSIACMPCVFPNAGMELCTDVFGPGGMRTGTVVAQADAHVCDWSWSNWSTHKTNGNTTLAVDGVETGGTVYGANPTSFTSTRRRIGNFDSVQSAASCLNGDILEIIAFTRQLTAPERQQVRRYLGSKWGVSVA